MTINKVVTSFKENVAWIIITAIFMLIPFYFNTTSSLNHINEKVEYVSKQAETNRLTIQSLSSRQLVQEERFRNIEKRLESIEKKLDYLIENDQ